MWNRPRRRWGFRLQLHIGIVITPRRGCSIPPSLNCRLVIFADFLVSGDKSGEKRRTVFQNRPVGGVLTGLSMRRRLVCAPTAAIFIETQTISKGDGL